MLHGRTLGRLNRHDDLHRRVRLAYQAASEHRAAKMDEQLQPGMTFSQVVKQFGEPDIEKKPTDTTEIWSYAKHANSNDVTAEVFYTSAKEGDAGTFEDLKFVDGSSPHGARVSIRWSQRTLRDHHYSQLWTWRRRGSAQWGRNRRIVGLVRLLRFIRPLGYGFLATACPEQSSEPVLGDVLIRKRTAFVTLAASVLLIEVPKIVD